MAEEILFLGQRITAADPARLEFAPDLLPEYMITGHEVSRFARIEVRPEHQAFFDFIRAHSPHLPGSRGALATRASAS